MASCGSCVKFLKFRSHINNLSGINLLFVANDRCRTKNEHPDQHPISMIKKNSFEIHLDILFSVAIGSYDLGK